MIERNKRIQLIPVVKFLRKFGQVKLKDILVQAMNDVLHIEAGGYSFCFVYDNGWRLIVITKMNEQVRPALFFACYLVDWGMFFLAKSVGID